MWAFLAFVGVHLSTCPSTSDIYMGSAVMTRRCILVSVEVVSLTAGCSGPAERPAESGPLGQAGEPGRVCTPVDDTGRITDGKLFLRNSGPDAVVLPGVSLVGSTGLSIDSGVVAPIVNNTLVGLRPGYVAARGAQPINGAKLVGDEELNLVLQLRLTSMTARGRADGVQVEYSSGGHTYRWLSPIAVDLGPPGMPCGTK